MGQAKVRKAEIAALKAASAKPLTIKILAIRHTADGQEEFCAFQSSVGVIRNDKNALLRHICIKDWLHNPPVDAIAEYLVQTNTYKTAKSLGLHSNAFIINFYESDRDRPNTYSCREIVGIHEKDFHTYAEHYKNSLDKNVMSIREYQ